MRKLSKSQHQCRNELTPWLQPNNSHRSQFDEVHFRSISLLNPPTYDSEPFRQESRHPSRKNKTSCFKMTIGKDRKPVGCGKTISAFKDYYRKHYTEEPEQFIEHNTILTKKKIKQNNLKLIADMKRNISTKKTSIIDLTKSLNDNINAKPNKIKIIIQKDQNNREQAYNRILKIKQEMIRNKQRKFIDKKQVEINEDELRPQSRSVPLRVKSVKKSSGLTFLPDKSFGNILSDFLQKI